MFHVIEEERKWRKQQGMPTKFDNMETQNIIISVGADQPLLEEKRRADNFCA